MNREQYIANISLEIDDNIARLVSKTDDEISEFWRIEKKDILKAIRFKEHLIEYLEEKIEMCDEYIDTTKSDLEEVKYTMFAYDNLKKTIEENIKTKNIYQDVLEKVRSGKYE